MPTGAWRHLKTITYHKYLVMKGCFAVGLYKQGLTHDLSKYEPTEFLMGAKYFQGDRSPNNAEREEKGYSSAWLHHKGRNRHHYEYWIDYSTRDVPGGMAPVEMPVKYVAEMLMDRTEFCHCTSMTIRSRAYRMELEITLSIIRSTSVLSIRSGRVGSSLWRPRLVCRVPAPHRLPSAPWPAQDFESFLSVLSG